MSDLSEYAQNPKTVSIDGIAVARHSRFLIASTSPAFLASSITRLIECMLSAGKASRSPVNLAFCSGVDVHCLTNNED